MYVCIVGLLVLFAELPDPQLHDKRRPAHSENTAYATYTSFCSCRVALTALFSRSVGYNDNLTLTSSIQKTHPAFFCRIL